MERTIDTLYEQQGGIANGNGQGQLTVAGDATQADQVDKGEIRAMADRFIGVLGHQWVAEELTDLEMKNRLANAVGEELGILTVEDPQRIALFAICATCIDRWNGRGREAAG